MADIFRMTARERYGLLVLVAVLAVVTGVLLAVKSCGDAAPGPIVEVKASADTDTAATDSMTVGGKEYKDKKKRNLNKSKGKPAGAKAPTRRDPMSEPKIN